VRERLQKIIAAEGVASRRQAEEWIREGRVFVNGAVARLGDLADLGSDAIRIGRRLLRPSNRPHRYFLVNKPRGILTTTADPEGRPTVLDLLPAGLRRGLKPVGRLDVSTEGLLLLTDDGDFAQSVSHPSRGVSKTYFVKVHGDPPEKTLARLRRGVVLDGRRTAPCEIARHHATNREGEGNAWLTVVLHEGRSRQIRRMFESVGHPVSKLRRTAIGPVRDDRLTPGSYRALKPGELRQLLKNGPADRRH